MTRCFIVMGYGKKQDYFLKNNVKPRKVNLDEIYNKLIKPSLDCLDNSFEYVRGDELQYSGMIDASMYDLLMTADLVIADITTLNANAMYELGIRHALKPYSTIIMKEQDDVNPPFDISHVRIFNYSIKDFNDEIKLEKLQKKLLSYVKGTLSKLLNNPQIDSPFFESKSFEYDAPKISNTEIDNIWSSAINNNSVISTEIEKANKFERNNQISNAEKVYENLFYKYGKDDFFIQRLAYLKSRNASKLIDAENIIKKLNPLSSFDTETTGIYGGIEKRLYLNRHKKYNLENAIKSYQRGYILKNDYYNGENYVNCLCIKFLNFELTNTERIYYIELINIISNQVLKLAHSEYNADENDYWAAATLSNCYLLINDNDNADFYSEEFEDKSGNSEEIKSFKETQKLRNDFLKKVNEK